MELRVLRYFLAVAQEESISRPLTNYIHSANTLAATDGSRDLSWILDCSTAAVRAAASR